MPAKPYRRPVVRQDAIRWLNKGDHTVVYKDPFGGEHTARVEAVDVWAYVGNAGLAKRLIKVIDELLPKTTARGLKAWQWDDDRALALDYFAAVERDLEALLELDWQALAQPNHGFQFARHPSALAPGFVTHWISIPPNTSLTETNEVGHFHYEALTAANTYGGLAVDAIWNLLRARLESMPEFLDNVNYQIAQVCELAATLTVEEVIERTLPAEWRTRCVICDRWIPKTRRDVKYHNRACLMKARRRRMRNEGKM